MVADTGLEEMLAALVMLDSVNFPLLITFPKEDPDFGVTSKIYLPKVKLDIVNGGLPVAAGILTTSSKISLKTLPPSDFKAFIMYEVGTVVGTTKSTDTLLLVSWVILRS